MNYKMTVLTYLLRGFVCLVRLNTSLALSLHSESFNRDKNRRIQIHILD